MSVGCLVITTNLPHRLGRTIALLNSIDQADNCFLDNRVLSIDLQPGVEGCENNLRQMYEERGWQVVQGDCTGERAMLNNIQRGLALIEEDALFYCEDHVIIRRLPRPEDLQFLFGYRDIGWINFNTHIHEENLLGVPNFVESPDREDKLAYINCSNHWLRVGPPTGDHYLVKKPQIKDEYYLNFPAAIAPRRIFAELLKYGLENYSGVGIEIGFTRAWFDTHQDERTDAAIYTLPKTSDQIPFKTFRDLHNCACMRFRNNDPEMLHGSIVQHGVIPQSKTQRRSFF